jgi:dipeptidyl-peptidase-3
VNETYSGLFGEVSSGYEECKADSVALFLSVFPDVMEVLLPELTVE